MPGRDFAAKDVWAASFPHFAARQRVQRVDSKAAVQFFVAAAVAIQLEAAALLVEAIVEGPAELVEKAVVEFVGVVVAVELVEVAVVVFVGVVVVDVVAVVVAVGTAVVDRVVISVAVAAGIVIEADIE